MVVSQRRAFLGAFISGALRLWCWNKEVGINKMNQQLKFETRFEIQQMLLVHYGVENQSSLDVYLLNRLHDLQYNIRSDLAYIDLDRQKKLVHISKQVPPIPPGVSPTMPVTPAVTPVRAGTRFSEILHIPLPVHEYREYASEREKEEKAPILYHGVNLCIQYYWSVSGMKEHTEVLNGVSVVIPTPPPGTRLNIGFLTSETTSLEIPVIAA